MGEDEDDFVYYIIAKEDQKEEYRYFVSVREYSPSIKHATKYNLNDGLSTLFTLKKHVLLKLTINVRKVNITIENYLRIIFGYLFQFLFS